jgi:chemotaxis protein methyltransferase CheR
MDDQQFRNLLDFLRFSWAGYRKVRKGVRKRVSRYMQQAGFRGIDEFLSAIERNPDLRKQVEILMTVSVSRFFRDRRIWEALERHVLPEIIGKRDEKVKVWSAGCACGEEPYSFKILWDAMQRRFERLPELELWATDMNPSYLEKARGGVYPLSSLKELPPEWRIGYFRPREESRFAVSDFLKEGVLWKVHNLLTELPPQRDLQIIFLRNNLLTYYKDEVKIPAVKRIIESLAPEGFLILGAHEKWPAEGQTLAPFPHHPNIFQKTTPMPPPSVGEGAGKGFNCA